MTKTYPGKIELTEAQKKTVRTTERTLESLKVGELVLSNTGVAYKVTAVNSNYTKTRATVWFGPRLHTNLKTSIVKVVDERSI